MCPKKPKKKKKNPILCDHNQNYIVFVITCNYNLNLYKLVDSLKEISRLNLPCLIKLMIGLTYKYK